MAKLNRTCMTCGEKYSYCPTCDEDYLKPVWYGLFHDENCKNIFDILSKQTQEYLSISEAKELLLKCDLSNKETFSEDIKRHINTILEYTAPVEPKKKIVNID